MSNITSSKAYFDHKNNTLHFPKKVMVKMQEAIITGKNVLYDIKKQTVKSKEPMKIIHNAFESEMQTFFIELDKETISFDQGVKTILTQRS
jgi:hypothetical protein